MLLGEHILLIGNQGVGKNVLADRLLELVRFSLPISPFYMYLDHTGTGSAREGVHSASQRYDRANSYSVPLNCQGDSRLGGNRHSKVSFCTYAIRIRLS